MRPLPLLPSQFFLLLLVVVAVSPVHGFAFLSTTQQQRRPITTTSCSALSASLKEATFGMGCFWEPSESLLKVEGVVETVAGYTGHPTATKAPTYDSVCFGRDWVEGVRVTYDEDRLSYEDLLTAFFQYQKPKWDSRQYASIVFPHDDEQTQIVQTYLQAEDTPALPVDWRKEWTTVEPLRRFYQAEGYHQNYWQKQRPRFAILIGLLAVSTGVLDSMIPLSYQHTVESGANALSLALGLYIIAERWFDAKVIEL